MNIRHTIRRVQINNYCFICQIDVKSMACQATMKIEWRLTSVSVKQHNKSVFFIFWFVESLKNYFKMLQRVIHSSFEFKICSRKSNFLTRVQSNYNLCFQCGSRLYSRSRVPAFLNYYERSFPNRNGLFNIRLRYYTSQVDAQKKNEHIESVKDKPTITTSKKINVKLKPSELRRLFSLAEPEKWTLTSMY